MKNILLLLLIALSVLSADAQSKRKKDTINLCQPGHYLVCDLGGGLHTLAYSVPGNGLKSPGGGFMFRAGYRYFFNKNWGIGTDLNLKSFATSYTSNYINTIDGAVDEEGALYHHRTYYNNLKEAQRQLVLGMPIAAYYQYRIDRQWKVGGGLGVIGQMEITNKYKTKKGNLETKGYYSDPNALLFGMSQHHFYQKSDFSGSIDKKTSLGIYGEGNVLYYYNPRISFNLGLYFAYGFGYQKESEGLMQFDPDCMSANAYNDTYNGLLRSDRVDKISPIAIGVMAGVRYQLRKKDRPKHGPDEPIHRDTIQIIIPDNPVDTIPVIADTVPNIVPDTIPVVVDTIPNVPDTEPVVVDTIPNVVPDKPTVQDSIELDFDKFRRFTVNFEFNDTIIRRTDKHSKMFNDLAAVMKKYPNSTLRIVGHTCDIGTLEQNTIVGMRRAEAFKEELVERGIDGSRITCESKAYTEPLVPNTNELNRRKNRRIEFFLSD